VSVCYEIAHGDVGLCLCVGCWLQGGELMGEDVLGSVNVYNLALIVLYLVPSILFSAMHRWVADSRNLSVECCQANQ